MFRKLRADEVEARISTCNQYGVGLLLYKDARCDMNILDETVGPFNWQRRHEMIDGRLYCSVGIKNPATGEWIWKQDVGTESYTEKEKGQASDSFKRACFNWYGRELYTAPDMWVRTTDLKTLTKDGTGSKYTCRDTFTVTRLEYAGSRICLVEVKNNKTGGLITFGQPAEAAKKEDEIRNQIIPETKAIVLQKTVASYKDLGLQEEKVLKHFGVETFYDMTEGQFIDCLNMIKPYENKRAKDGV